MQIKLASCVASPYDDKNSDTGLLLFDETQSAETLNVGITKNCGGDSAEFSFDAFMFKDPAEANGSWLYVRSQLDDFSDYFDQVFLFCEIDLCDGPVEVCGCETPHNYRRSARNTNSISVGPFFVRN